MAENIVQGLFGLSPYDVQQSRLQDTNAQALQYAKLDPFQKANMSLYQAGGGLGRMGAGMMGMVDPKEQEAQLAEMGQSQIDHSTPEGLLKGAEMFNQVGNPKMAMMYAQAAQAMEAKNADIAKDKAYSNYYNRDMTQSGLSKLNQKDYTPESFAIFLETGNRADLVPIVKDYIVPQGAVRFSGANNAPIASAPFDPRYAPAPAPVTVVDPTNPSQSIIKDARTGDVLGVSPKLPGTELSPDKIMKLKLSQPKTKLGVSTAVRNLDLLKDAIVSLKNDKGLNGITGLIYGNTGSIKGESRRAKAKLDTIKSQLFVTALQSMRSASPTGGAVGNVSDKEGQRLETSLASLDRNLDLPDFISQLDIILSNINGAKDSINNAYDEEYSIINNAINGSNPTNNVIKTADDFIKAQK